MKKVDNMFMKSTDRLVSAVTVIFAFLALIGQTEFNIATILVGLLMGYCGARLFVRAK